jgi:hypothetical protein
MSKIKFASMITLFITIAFLFAAGCGEQKKEEAQTGDEPNTIKSDTSMSETSSDPSSDKEPVVEEPVVNIPDLKGTWTGKFDSRSTTLKITEQDSVSFKGSITINYREVINQQVSGTLDVEKKTFTMKDLLHSRYAGNYSGKLSEDLNNITGSFTSRVDKNTFTFNLNRK